VRGKADTGKRRPAQTKKRVKSSLNSFDKVQLPYVNGPAPPERYLDMRRYWSDVTISVLEDLEKIRQHNVPNFAGGF